MTKKFKVESNSLKEELSEKYSQVLKINEEISALKVRMQNLETNIDSVDQYERRDTIIVSGSQQENAANIFTSAIKEHLKINIAESDINIAYRIGPVRCQRKLAIIVKLCNRSLSRPGWGLHQNEASTLHQRKSHAQTTPPLLADSQRQTCMQGQVPTVSYQGWENRHQV